MVFNREGRFPSSDYIVHTLCICLWFLCLGLKLGFLWWETQPYFAKKNISLEFSQPKISDLDLKIHREAERYHISFNNKEERDVIVGVDPGVAYEVQVSGEKTHYQTNDQGISFHLPTRMWGKTNIEIKRASGIKPYIDLLLLLSISSVILFFRTKPIPRWIPLSAIVFSLIFIGLYITRYSGLIFEKTNISDLEKLYYQSQYIQGQGSREVIGDDVVYSFAGIKYAEGGDPTTINFEHPPLAKLMYGWSALLTGRAGVVSLLFYFLTFVLFGLLSWQLLKDTLMWSFSLVLFAVDEAVLYLSTTSTLDLPLLMFLLLAAVFFLQGKRSGTWFWFLGMSLSLGMAVSTKIFFTATLFTVALFAHVLLEKRRLVLPFLLSLLFLPVPFLMSYYSYFHYHSVADFISFLRWQLSWYRTKPNGVPFGIVFITLFFGKFTAWWDLEKGRIISIAHWTPLWTFYTFVTGLSLFYYSKSKDGLFILLWLTIYILFLSLGAAAENLLIVILPFFILAFLQLLKGIGEPNLKHL